MRSAEYKKFKTSTTKQLKLIIYKERDCKSKQIYNILRKIITGGEQKIESWTSFINRVHSNRRPSTFRFRKNRRKRFEKLKKKIKKTIK